jgi:Uma2 family endonuclease
MGTLPVARITEQDYLALERAADYKSEFVAGEMFAMSGGTTRHARLASKVLSMIDRQLDGKECVAVNSDLKIRTPGSDHFYPDVSVICGPIQTHAGNKDVCTNPVVIVEVLSPSTANYDRGLKFVLYREIPSLKDYLVFFSDSVHVEHYTRQSSESWLLQNHHGDEARILLPSINCELTLGPIYAGAMDWPG